MFVFIQVLTVIAKKTKNPVFIRIAFHMQFFTKLMVVFDFQNLASYDDLKEIVMVSQPLMIGLFCLFFIPMCVVEQAIVHVPLSILYMLITNVAFFSLYYGLEVGHEKRITYVLEKYKPEIVIKTLQFIIGQYSIYFAILYN